MVRVLDIPGLVIRRLATKRRLAHILRKRVSEVNHLFDEFIALNLLSSVAHRVRNTDYFKAGMLYTLCRLIRPNVVVETGVAAGTSSTGLLAALEQNQKGRLFSLDFPNAKYRKDDGSNWADSIGEKEPGWLVPDSLRSRWTLNIGRSSELLPSLVADVKSVDLFYHDSEHTDENMTFELETIWPVLSKGALVVADNVDWSPAFTNFRVRHNLDSTFLFPYVGVASN
jgi:predicted O-methyltransferase YrrM